MGKTNNGAICGVFRGGPLNCPERSESGKEKGKGKEKEKGKEKWIGKGARKGKGTEKAKRKGRKYKSAGDFISKPPG